MELGQLSSRLYKKFQTLEDYVNTFPINALKVLHKWSQKHNILLPDVFYDDNKKSFDVINCVIHGPFQTSSAFFVEQRQINVPKFSILWDSNKSEELEITFYSPNE